MTTEDERFWAKVDRRSNEECWEWKAGRNTFGYGAFHPTKRKTVGAHRWSLAKHLGRDLAPGAFACHTCDNPSCVNPGHLYEGTSQDNVDDAVSRGRHKHGDRGATKLSAADVIAIREAVAQGMTSRQAAAKWGLSEAMLSGIVRGNRWASAPGPLTYHYKKKKV